jgi:F-type H+-transporting ATPase subunit gamma
MPSLKEVRTRIASVNSTKQITSAMKMVSASKLRRAQTAILKLRPYSMKLNEIMGNLKSSVGNSDEAVYFAKRKEQKILLVVLTSNRGLCGAFNSNSIKLAVQTIHEDYQKQYEAGNVSVMCIGKKAYEFFNKRNYHVVANHSHIYDDLNYENSLTISSSIMKEFASGLYDKVELFYGQFRNAAMQRLTREQFLPILQSETGEESKNSTDYIFEPGRQEIVSDLVPKTLRIQFYKALLDSFASEHGARMTAMHKATDNADSLLKELRLSYNKARQASITTEILEIISGANALKG